MGVAGPVSPKPNLWLATARFHIDTEQLFITIGIAKKHRPSELAKRLIWHPIPEEYRSASVELKLVGTNPNSFDLRIARRAFPYDRNKLSQELEGFNFRILSKAVELRIRDHVIVPEAPEAVEFFKRLQIEAFEQLLQHSRECIVFLGSVPAPIHGLYLRSKFVRTGESLPPQPRREIIDFN
jgi:hypothetical protein